MHFVRLFWKIWFFCYLNILKYCLFLHTRNLKLSQEDDLHPIFFRAINTVFTNNSLCKRLIPGHKPIVPFFYFCLGNVLVYRGTNLKLKPDHLRSHCTVIYTAYRYHFLQGGRKALIQIRWPELFDHKYTYVLTFKMIHKIIQSPKSPIEPKISNPYIIHPSVFTDKLHSSFFPSEKKHISIILECFKIYVIIINIQFMKCNYKMCPRWSTLT